MSTLLKKKGALGFKPKKAPQPRRPAASTPAAISSALSSLESQSQAHIPALRTNSPPVDTPLLEPNSTSDQRSPTKDGSPSDAVAENTHQIEQSADQQRPSEPHAVNQIAENVSPVPESTQLLSPPSSRLASLKEQSTNTADLPSSATTVTEQDAPFQELASSTITIARISELQASEATEPAEADVGDASMLSVATAESSILSPERGAARDIASLINAHALRSPVKPTSKPTTKNTPKTIQRPPKPALGSSRAASTVRQSPVPQLPTPYATQETALLRNTPEVDTVDLSRLGAGEAARPGENVPEVPLNADGTIAGEDPILSNDLQVPSAKSPKRKRSDAPLDEVRPTVEGAAPKIKRVRGPAKNPRKKKAPADPNAEPKKRKKRDGTPSDAEDQEIDHSTMKMADLCKDIKIGRKFSKHDEIKQREIQRKAKLRLGMGESEVGDGSNSGTPQPAAPSNSEPGPVSMPNPSGGPRMRLVDGQIVIDDSSLVVDRHKRAAEEALVLEEIEENDFTRVVTSGSFMKREKTQGWNLEDLELFYDGLRMFGTDFEMISKMFPHRNRRQIKLKFNKEERSYPRRIAKTLVGEKVPIDFEQYASLTGIKYEEVADIEGEAARVQAEHDAEQKKLDDEIAEVTRRKKAAIQGRVDGAEGESAKENDNDGGNQSTRAGPAKTRGKTNAKKKRNMHSIRGGGEEVEVLGSI